MDAARGRVSLCGELLDAPGAGQALRAVRAAEELVSAVSVAFGPEGLGVLLQGGAGGLTITRGALDILEAAFPAASPAVGPEHVVLLQSARALRQQAGDGVKGFLLTAVALLRGLLGLQHRGAVPASVRAELRRAGLALSSAVPPCGHERQPAPAAANVAESVLATRFTRDVAAAALPAVEALLRTAPPERLRRDLGVLCRLRHAAGRAVGDSTLRDGVVLGGSLLFADARPRHVVVLAGDEGDKESDVQAAVRALLAGADVATTGPLLVVTAAALSDVSLFELRRAGAAVLHCVAPDEERFVLDWTLAANGDRAIGVVVRAEPRGAVWLELAGVRQLQVHAPTQPLAEQIGSAVRDAVQLACLMRSTAPPGDPLCPGGGALERSLHRALGGTPLGRAELLRWHQQRDHDIANAHPVVGDLVAALGFLSPDLKKIVAEAVAAVPRALPVTPPCTPPPEPVALRVAVLQHALGAVGALLGVDRTLVARRPQDQSQLLTKS